MAKKRKIKPSLTLLDSGVILTKKDSSLNDRYECKLIEVNGKVLEGPINVEFKLLPMTYRTQMNVITEFLDDFREEAVFELLNRALKSTSGKVEKIEIVEHEDDYPGMEDTTRVVLFLQVSTTINQ